MNTDLKLSLMTTVIALVLIVVAGFIAAMH